jgi:hypothetical protein
MRVYWLPAQGEARRKYPPGERSRPTSGQRGSRFAGQKKGDNSDDLHFPASFRLKGRLGDAFADRLTALVVRAGEGVNAVRGLTICPNCGKSSIC